MGLEASSVAETRTTTKQKTPTAHTSQGVIGIPIWGGKAWRYTGYWEGNLAETLDNVLVTKPNQSHTKILLIPPKKCLSKPWKD